MAKGNVYNNFDFVAFFVFELRAYMGQSDRQTDGQARCVTWPIGWPHNKRRNYLCTSDGYFGLIPVAMTMLSVVKISYKITPLFSRNSEKQPNIQYQSYTSIPATVTQPETQQLVQRNQASSNIMQPILEMFIRS